MDLYTILLPHTSVLSFLHSRGLCWWHLWLVSPFFLWPDLHGDFSQTAPVALSLRLFITSGSLTGCESVQVHHPNLPPVGARISSKSGQCSYIRSSYFGCRLFFFGGDGPLHNILKFIFCSPMEVPTVCFAISSSTVCLKDLLSVLLLPRRNRSSRSRSLMPLLHSSSTRHVFSNVHPFEVLPATLSLVQFFCHLCWTLSSLWPHAVPFLHCGSYVCRRWSTSSRTHRCPGSISSAVSGAW
jgi:hypothetical protein